jgi:hypothetical protein
MKREPDAGKYLWGNALEIAPEVRPDQLEDYRRALLADAQVTLGKLVVPPRGGEERVVIEMSWHFERKKVSR